jgi:hypothetical protein
LKLAETQRMKIINNILKATQKADLNDNCQNRAIPPKVKSLADEYESRILLDFS